MNVPYELKLNRYRPVQIPSGREIFNRFGFSEGRNFSGDEYAGKPMSKVDAALALDNANQFKNEREAAVETNI